MMSEISLVVKTPIGMTTKTNSNKSMIMNANLTKRGLVSMWESGGGMCNTGNAVIIAKSDGAKATAVYIRRRGQLSCDDHALIPVHPGYFIIKSYHHHRDFQHEIFQVIRVFTEGEGENKKGFVEVALINSFDEGEWDAPLGNLEDAVAAAEAKATDYHCRSAYYVVEKEKKD